LYPGTLASAGFRADEVKDRQRARPQHEPAVDHAQPPDVGGELASRVDPVQPGWRIVERARTVFLITVPEGRIKIRSMPKQQQSSFLEVLRPRRSPPRGTAMILHPLALREQR